METSLGENSSLKLESIKGTWLLPWYSAASQLKHNFITTSGKVWSFHYFLGFLHPQCCPRMEGSDQVRNGSLVGGENLEPHTDNLEELKDGRSHGDVQRPWDDWPE